MGAIPDKLKNGIVTYAQRADFRLPWWATRGYMPNLIETADAKNVAKWLAAAGMGFEVKGADTFIREADGSYTALTDYRAQLRTDRAVGDGFALGVVSPDFNNVQPSELISGFIDRIQSEDIQLTTMGVMKKGRNIFMGARLSDTYARQIGPDLTESWLMFHTRYDGGGATIAGISTVCPVCENTVSAAISQALRMNSLYRVPHRSVYSSADLRNALELATVEINERATLFNRLVETKLTDADVEVFFATLLDIPPADLHKTENGKPVVSARARNQLAALVGAYRESPGAEKRIGTAWGAFNAVTFYTDHIASTRDTTGEGEVMARQFTAMYGKGRQVKARALELLVAKAGLKDLRVAA